MKTSISGALAILAAVGLVAVGCAACNNVSSGGPPLPIVTIETIGAPVGLVSQIDGSKSSDPGAQALSYTWSLVKVPAGSTATLSSLTTTTSTLAADSGGDYDVRLTVRAADGRINAATSTLHVPNDPIFYVTGDVLASKTTIYPSLLSSDGRGDRIIGCTAEVPFGLATTSTNIRPSTGVAGAGLFATTTSPGPSGRFVYSVMVPVGSGFGLAPFIADATSACATNTPVRLDTEATAAIGEMPLATMFPRVSPNGKRVLMLIVGGEVIFVSTVGVDGKGLRVIREYPSSKNAQIAPTWIDDTTVAWGENAGGASNVLIKLYKGPDENKSATTPKLIHDCAGVFQAVNQFELLPGGKIALTAAIVSHQDNPAGAVNLYVQPLGTCSASVGQVTTSDPPHYAADFAISTDKKQMVFAWDRDAAATTQDLPKTQLFITSLEGTPTPTKLVIDDTVAQLGPRFVNGDKQIAFSKVEFSPTLHTPTQSSLWIVNTDGSGLRALKQPPVVADENHFVLAGNNQGGACSMGGEAARGAWLSAFVVVVGLLLRRRRYSRL